MSSISVVSGGSYPVAPGAPQGTGNPAPKPAPAADPDHDGDSDKAGTVDVEA